MSTEDYAGYVDLSVVPPLTKALCQTTLTDYPPFLERLYGPWARLSKLPFTGITTDGVKIEGLFTRQRDGAPVAAAAQAASRWLDALPPETRKFVQFPLQSELWRYWQNTPLIVGHDHIELESLDLALREQALEVVRASLSAEGFRRTQEVMANNLFLGRLVDMTEILNDWAFTFSIFGTPSSVEPWGWQLFGHHLALNCLFVDGQMALSPVFMGLEPDHAASPSRRRMFEPHETRSLALFQSLTDAEQRRARLYGSMLVADQPPGRFHPDDGRAVGGAFQDNRIVPFEGVAVGALGRAQQRAVMTLAELFVENMPDGPADARLREVERYLDRTHFAWIGQANEVDPFYFRIHSPVVLIEFDHHSGIFLANREPARFHVHSIVRTPNGGDYGFDLLRQHYALGGHDHPDDHHHDHDDGRHSHDGGQTFHRHD